MSAGTVHEPLAAYLDASGLGSGRVDVAPVGDGHSNISLLVSRGDMRLVLRRPPEGPLPPSAHDVVREAELLLALHSAGVTVPRVRAIERDPAVLGVPFFLMDFVDGVVLGDATPPGLADPAAREAVAFAVVDALAALHAVPWQGTELERFGRRGGYLDRQLRRFAELWELGRTREVDGMAELTERLAGARPPERETTVVHGDFRLGNAIFSARPPVELRALLDWEMATLGDPLADLGYLTATYAEHGRPETVMSRLGAVSLEAGFPSSDALAERYAAATGRSLGALPWYQALALWKSAIFLEQSYKRYRAGTSDDPFFASLGAGVPGLVEQALQRLNSQETR